MKTMIRIAALSLCAVVALSGAVTVVRAKQETAAASENVQIPNPWVDCKTIEEAEALAGFSFQLPETPDGYAIENISVIEKELIQVLYKKGEQEICIRKGAGTGDISGDYTDYTQTVTKTMDGSSVTLKGSNGEFHLAIWDDGEYAYAVFSRTAQTEDALTRLAESVVLENLVIGGDPATWGPALD